MQNNGENKATNHLWIMVAVILAMVILGIGISYILERKNLDTEIDLYQTAQEDNEANRLRSLSELDITLELSAEEQRWLSDTVEIRIGYLEDYMPFSRYNEMTKEPEGLLVDLLEQISSVYGVSFTYEVYASYSEMKAAVTQGEVDAAFPAVGACRAESEDIDVSQDFLNSTMVMYRRSTAMDTVAVSSEDPFQRCFVELCFPNVNVLNCGSLTACIEAVSDGRADFTLIEKSVSDAMQIDTEITALNQTELPLELNISFAVNAKCSQLLSILDKGIMSEKAEVISEWEQQQADRAQENSASQSAFQKNISALIIAVVIVCYFIITLLLLNAISKRKNKEKIAMAEKTAEDASWRAEHDAMTGLLNRVAYDKLEKQLRDSERPMALLVFDVDHFKKINDTYGHKTGDKALIQVGEVITHAFRREDYIIRYAGDEFVVFMTNITDKQSEIIAGKVKKINETLQITAEYLSVSVGVAFSSRGLSEGLFEKADSALYKVKNEMGRCSYCIYEEEA